MNLSEDARALMLALADLQLFDDPKRYRALQFWDPVRMAEASHELEENGLLEHTAPESLS